VGGNPENPGFYLVLAEEQTARAISAYVQFACLLSLQMGSKN
jgi:hypothetical protein